MKLRQIVPLALAMLALTALRAPAQALPGVELKSPDGNVALTFHLTTAGEPAYLVSYKGRPVLLESRLGLELEGALPLTRGFTMTGELKRDSHDETWNPVAAERSPIRDHYNGATVTMTDIAGRKLQLSFRAYDEGAAFRTTVPAQQGLKDFTITGEASEFRFDNDYRCWPVYTAQAQYNQSLQTISNVKKGCERPLTVELDSNLYAAIGEAGLNDYSRMKFQPAGGRNALKASLEGTVKGAAPFSSPWRFVLVGEKPGQLLERNYLVLNLNEPSLIKDTSWIKPGKVIRETSLSTVGGKACVDFAVKMGLSYIEYDAGWYGHEYDAKSDASGVHLDPLRSKGPLDLQAVIDYGKEKGIGVILYVNHLALEKQADQIFPLYEKWGVRGVKFGFVNVGPQQWSKWVFDHVKKAADHHLMVDIHDEYRQTGISRTLPNLMTTEGVGGDEEFPPATHMAALPFTRALCGSYDNTICMFDNRLLAFNPNQKSKNKKPVTDQRKSRAFQLAKAVVVFSPWQFIFWYDRPESYHGEPELDFWKTIPTVWDETRVVSGVIGQYATIARRSGDTWYVGTVNAGKRRTLRIPLRFLGPGKQYNAEIYNEGAPDSREAADLIKIKIEKQTVDSATMILAEVSDIGGHAMKLTPVK